MRPVQNSGTDRAVDVIRPELQAGRQLDVVTSAFSLFAFAELRQELERLDACRLLLPAAGESLRLVGVPGDRAATPCLSRP